MHSKLAGHLPLQDLIQSTLMSAKTKLAAAEEKEKKKVNPFAKKNEEKGESKTEEKKEHESGKETMSSAIDPSNPGDIEKLASALEAIGDDLIKEADSIENGGESKQGGEQIPTNNPVSGTQPYKRDGSKKHQIPTATGMQADPSQGKAATQVPNDHARAPGGTGATYPAKGVLKTAAEAVKEMVEKKKADKEEKKEEPKEKKSGIARLQAAIEKVAEESYGGRKNVSHSFNLTGASEHANEERGRQKGRQIGAGVGAGLGAAGGAIGAGIGAKKGLAVRKLRGGGGAKHKALAAGGALLATALGAAGGGMAGRGVGGSVGRTVGVMKGPGKDKESSAVDYILGKIAESSQGGMTLDSPSGVGPKPESDAAGGNDARKALESAQSAISFQKVDGKKPQKRMLAEVLTEPAMSKATDSKVHENLRNAAAGGVKIAAARAYLAKIAADESNPKHEELKKALAKKKEEKSGEKPEEKKES